ncbi:MAG: glycosyltransferase, partial [Planctomycetes bacterium]|nr:glycosyltransferase [Planctomycetota bacterium]
MRVVHLNQDPGTGPAKKKGAAVHVACMRRAFERRGATVAGLDVPGREVALGELRALHADGGIDLIYERYALDADAGATFAREHGVPLVLEVNAPLLLEAAEHRGRAVAAEDEARERAVLTAAHVVLCVSNGVADYVRGRGIDPTRVIVRPNGVDSDVFRPRAATDTLRTELGLDRRFVVGFHGRLRPWHGFENVVEAARRLAQRGVDSHVLAVGE